MHHEHASQGGYSERAETYLRLLAEAMLRQTADGHADRVRRAGDLLVDAGVLSDRVAAQIMSDLLLAMRVRQGLTRPSAARRGAVAARIRRLSHYPALPPGDDPAQSAPWRVLPAGPATAGSRLMAVIITADRALAPATLFFPAFAGLPEYATPPFAELTGTDDLNTAYRLAFSEGTWAGSAWTGTVMFHPAPPAAARWLALNSSGGQLLRADLSAAAADAAAALRSEPVTESPGERLLTRQAEAMLAALPIGNLSGHSSASLAEAVATLEGAGALSPLSRAPARLAALGQLLGLPTEGPADEVPARWTAVLAHYGRRRRLVPVTGTGAIGAELPELDGTRFAIAGLRSGGAGSFLHVVVRGLRPFARHRSPGPPVDTGFSWWLRDDADGWHLGMTEDVSLVGGLEGLLRLTMLPPLDHATTAMTVQVTGQAQQATATLPVRW